jgi:6-pyruvoyltetrahydropterin/6-carboxytetrahydropterin synthase
MYAIDVQRTFSAAHALRLPGGGVEPLHGHDFQVTVRIACRELDKIETVLDFHLVEQWLGEVIGGWGNRNLNDIEPFKTKVNPSAERIAEQIGMEMVRRLKQHTEREKEGRGLYLVEVRITEAPGCAAIWTPGDSR